MAKRLFDLVFSSLCLLLAMPVILVVAILIKLESSGPVLYVPLMVGRGGKLFRLFRFRTMLADDSACSSSDERLTRVGRFIRNYSLDHLPTLVNVLGGDPSVAGPRPMEPEFVDLEDPAWQRYFQVRPGLFNYAVLRLGKTFGPSKAGNLPLKQELELEYIQKQSLAFDLRLFTRFVWAHIASGGNIKARGKPDPALGGKTNSRESRRPGTGSTTEEC
jgi:lipopolysaccharide/colanic/teichoic acid biosynthesis glycosyltransferase